MGSLASFGKLGECPDRAVSEAGGYRLTDRHANVTSFDTAGRMTVRRDPVGNETTYVYVDGNNDGTAD